MCIRDRHLSKPLGSIRGQCLKGEVAHDGFMGFKAHSPRRKAAQAFREKRALISNPSEESEVNASKVRWPSGLRRTLGKRV